MADNYLQFSTVVKLETPEEKLWMRDQILKRADIEDFEDALDCDATIEEEGLWLRSGESANLEPVAKLMKDFLKKFHPDRFLKMTWSVSCSKLRADEFDGGAFFVTSKRITWSGSWKFFNRMEEEFKKAKTKPKKKAKASRKGSRQR